MSFVFFFLFFICFIIFFLLPPCIINKWHLDFIKVPRPLWQYNVTGGHFNISRKRLSWYYLRQPVAPEDEEEEEEKEERCHVSGYRCLEDRQEPRDGIEQVKVHSQPGSSLPNLSGSALLPGCPLFPGRQID